MLLKAPPCPEERRHSVRFGLGAGLDPQLHRAFEERFGIPMVEVWGMTETGRFLADNHEPRRIDTRAFGKPTGDFLAKVVDETDREVPHGQEGELVVRWAGPDPRAGFFRGYLKDEAATAEAWRGDWFHTGDVVTQEPDGMLHFVERRKNIIRRSGENISAAEVENALVGHPAVARLAVIPVTDELRDEEVLACVVLTEGHQPTAETAAAILDQGRSPPRLLQMAGMGRVPARSADHGHAEDPEAPAVSEGRGPAPPPRGDRSARAQEAREGGLTMRIVRFERHGAPEEVLDCVEAPEPRAPGPGEVALDMVAMTINPADLLTVEGRYGVVPPPLPFTPGAEGGRAGGAGRRGRDDGEARRSRGAARGQLLGRAHDGEGRGPHPDARGHRSVSGRDAESKPGHRRGDAVRSGGPRTRGLGAAERRQLRGRPFRGPAGEAPGLRTLNVVRRLEPGARCRRPAATSSW